MIKILMLLLFLNKNFQIYFLAIFVFRYNRRKLERLTFHSYSVSEISRSDENTDKCTVMNLIFNINRSGCK